MKSRDLRNLEFPPGAAEASHALKEYYSDRSVALLFAGADGSLAIASGVCVRIGDLSLIATAAHNLGDVADLGQIRALPGGDRSHPGLRLSGFSNRLDSTDMAWLLIDAEDSESCTSLRFATVSDISCGYRHDPTIPFWIQGYPSAEVEIEHPGGASPLSLCLMTNSVENEDRGSELLALP